jgi:3-hydroxyisobutyrate dehydrogenase-like beta-hydroxyacid dehydrogenase
MNENNENIGFIGLGKMGLPMAMNLLNSGYRVYGSDVNPASASELQKAGGKTGHFSNWVPAVQTIILMLPSSTIVNHVIEEILATYETMHSNQTERLTIIDMSSSYPHDTKTNGEKLKLLKIDFMDAPVSGGIQKARSASLTIMAGGEEEVFKKCKRLLHSLGKQVFHIGPLGSGHLLKALNNYLSATHLLSACEAVQLMTQYGVQPEKGIEVFNHSTGRSGSTEYKFPSFILNERFDSGFSLELMKKDVEMAKRLFEDYGAETVLPRVVHQRFEEASLALESLADHTEIYRYVTSYLLKRGNSREENEEMVSGPADIRSGL